MAAVGGMTLAQCRAYRAKRQREQPAADGLTRRLRTAVGTFETYLNSLAYQALLVEHVEALVEEQLALYWALPSYRGNAFTRELVMEDYSLWPEALYGPYPLTAPDIRDGGQGHGRRSRRTAR